MLRHDFRLSIISKGGVPRECVPPGRSFGSDASSSRVRTNFPPRSLNEPALRLSASPTSASNSKNPEERRNGGRGPHVHTRLSFLEERLSRRGAPDTLATKRNHGGVPVANSATAKNNRGAPASRRPRVPPLIIQSNQSLNSIAHSMKLSITIKRST